MIAARKSGRTRATVSTRASTSASLMFAPHEARLESRVKLLVGRVAIRVGAGPPIEMNRRMRGIRSVGNVVTEDARVVDDPRFDPRLDRIRRRAPLTEVLTQLLRQLEHLERKQAHHDAVHVRGGERVEIAEPIASTQRRGEHGGRRHFHIDEVIGLRSAIERRIDVCSRRGSATGPAPD